MFLKNSKIARCHIQFRHEYRTKLFALYGTDSTVRRILLSRCPLIIHDLLRSTVRHILELGGVDRFCATMGMANRLKIVIAGPKKSGKTVISNFLCDPSNVKTGNLRYDPTMGCRIIECEMDGVQLELWDVGGDHSFENCWPAIIQGIEHSATDRANSNNAENKIMDGILLVCNPDQPTQEEEVCLWYDHFVKNTGLSDDGCLVFLHTAEQPLVSDSLSGKRTPLKLAGCGVHQTSFFTMPAIREHFAKFVRTVAQS